MRNLFVFGLLALFFVPAKAQDKKTPAYYFERGEQSMAKKEYISAQAHFTECIRLDPYFAEAYRLRGMVREYLGEKAKALTDFNVYVDLKPDNSEVLFERAVLRFEGEQWLPARQDFLKLLTLPPGETNTVRYSQEKFNEGAVRITTRHSDAKDYIYNYLGLCESNLKRFTQALAWMDSAVKVAPGNPLYLINRSQIRSRAANNKGALADLQKALELDPENGLALHNLALLKQSSGESEASEKLLTDAISKNERLPYPRAQRAYQRLEKNDLKGALEDYDEVVRLEPMDAENYVNRGIVKEKMRDLAGAATDFSKAIELDSKNPKAWLGHGNVQSKLARWKEAISDYTAALHLDPTYSLALYNRGVARTNAGLHKEACEDITAAAKSGVKVDPAIRQKACK
ncbi:MAG TPA: tetratricopeptide repeat protein [Cyclobacteriaceae bacterium]|nr:tetratricopeptide repeat protein [Cyclobacteriaceae bacterium]